MHVSCSVIFHHWIHLRDKRRKSLLLSSTTEITFTLVLLIIGKLADISIIISVVIRMAILAGRTVGPVSAGFAGLVLAETIAGDATRFDLLSILPGPAFPGGQMLRNPIMTLAMTWFSLRDKLGL